MWAKNHFRAWISWWIINLASNNMVKKLSYNISLLLIYLSTKAQNTFLFILVIRLMISTQLQDFSAMFKARDNSAVSYIRYVAHILYKKYIRQKKNLNVTYLLSKQQLHMSLIYQYLSLKSNRHIL